MAINESAIRRIIREEARRVLRESSYDPRLEQYKDEVDQPAHMIISNLRMPEVEDVYPEAGELRTKMEDLRRDFDEGMAVIRPSKDGGPDEFDIFLNHTNELPINSVPIPRRAFGIMGISLEGGLSSASARRRGISGY